jgi:hypothetical protein
MKKNLLFLMILFVMNFVSIHAQFENLISNGGFEESTIGEATASSWWLTDGTNASCATFLIDTIRHTGEKGLSVTVVDRPSTANAWDIQAGSTITVELNTFYRYSVWAKTETSKATVNFTVGMAADPYTQLGTVNSPKLSKSWTKINILFNSMENTSISAPIHFTSDGKTYIDDLSIIKSNILGAKATGSGDSVIIDFGWGLRSLPTAFDSSAFTVYIGYAKNPVIGVFQNLKKRNLLKLTLTKKIKSGDSVSISYSSEKGNLNYYTPATGISKVVEDFKGEQVENLISGGGNKVNELSLSVFSVYPNPVGDILYLNNNIKLARIEVASVSGQRVMIVNNPVSNEISVSRLQKGVYFLSVYGSDGSYRNLKFIKN